MLEEFLPVMTAAQGKIASNAVDRGCTVGKTNTDPTFFSNRLAAHQRNPYAMLQTILLLSSLVGILALVYPILTASRFLGFAAYIGAGGGSSIYSTTLACHAYLETPSPVPTKTSVDCFGAAAGILVRGIASFLAGGKLEDFVVGAWEVWVYRRA